METTLADFIAGDLAILSIGINPSLHAVRAGFPFAFKRNRFWPALNASRLVDEILEPGIGATEYLLQRYRIGFTDVVKRPTPGAAQLRAQDFSEWAPVLAQKIVASKPAMLWFHGKLAVTGFCRSVLPAQKSFSWGYQDYSILGTPCFVSPNPSPANASYSLQDIVASYDELACRVQPPH